MKVKFKKKTLKITFFWGGGVLLVERSLRFIEKSEPRVQQGTPVTVLVHLVVIPLAKSNVC